MRSTFVRTVALTIAGLACRASAQCPQSVQELSPTGVLVGQNYGFTMDAEPTRLVIGGRFDNELANDAGSVYVYELINGQWVLDAKLFADDADAGDAFGMAVALDGNRIAVASPLDDEVRTDAGAAYIFERQQGQWAQTAKVFSSGLKTGSLYGVSIDLQGSTLVVGAREQPVQQINGGAVYIYEELNGQWSKIRTLVSPDLSPTARFGQAVTMDQDTLLVGSFRQAHSGLSEPGATYVFTKVDGRWDYTQTLTHPTPTTNAWFGVSLDLEGDLAIISSRRAEISGNGMGFVSVFRRSQGRWHWAEDIFSPAAQRAEEFGSKIGLHNGKLLVGSWLERVDQGPTSGAAYLFEHQQGAYRVLGSMFAPANGADSDSFGHDVVLAGSRSVVAGFGLSSASPGAGGAFSYDFTDCYVCPADLSADGRADSADIQKLISLFLDRSPKADLNADGIFDMGDIHTFIRWYLIPC